MEMRGKSGLAGGKRVEREEEKKSLLSTSFAARMSADQFGVSIISIISFIGIAVMVVS